MKRETYVFHGHRRKIDEAAVRDGTQDEGIRFAVAGRAGQRSKPEVGAPIRAMQRQLA